MKLPRISSYQVSRLPDQTSEWLNRLNAKVDELEQRLADIERQS